MKGNIEHAYLKKTFLCKSANMNQTIYEITNSFLPSCYWGDSFRNRDHSISELGIVTFY